MTRIPATERRAALIQAALRVIAARGVSGATTRAIVAEAGMSLASFHYAFSSRDELMTELVGWVVEQEQRSIAPALAADDRVMTMADAIRTGLEHYLTGVRRDPDHEKAMLELTHYALRSARMQPLARRQYERYHALAAGALAVAADKGGERWRRPLDEVASLLVVLTDGLTISWLVNRDDRAASTIIDFAADAIARLAGEPDDHSQTETAASP